MLHSSFLFCPLSRREPGEGHPKNAERPDARYGGRCMMILLLYRMEREVVQEKEKKSQRDFEKPAHRFAPEARPHDFA
jgi:hypothetical protein